jgi:hypothetical protein
MKAQIIAAILSVIALVLVVYLLAKFGGLIWG